MRERLVRRRRLALLAQLVCVRWLRGSGRECRPALPPVVWVHSSEVRSWSTVGLYFFKQILI